MGFLLEGGWKLVAGGVVIAIVAMLVWQFEASIKKAVYEQFYAQEVQQQLQLKQGEIDRLNQLHAVDLKAIQDLNSRTDAQKANIARLTGQLKNLQDGAVAPVLRQTLKSLEAPAK